MLRDVVINEGIKRWDIRYYLVALNEGPTGITLDVCFPVGGSYSQIMPYLNRRRTYFHIFLSYYRFTVTCAMLLQLKSHHYSRHRY
jgi:hypothetical protein